MGRDERDYAYVVDAEISTHSPRVGRDMFGKDSLNRSDFISTHSPRVGRDKKLGNKVPKVIEFQPTLPVWGETERVQDWLQWLFISTHSPRVGRDYNTSQRRG